MCLWKNAPSPECFDLLGRGFALDIWAAPDMEVRSQEPEFYQHNFQTNSRRVSKCETLRYPTGKTRIWWQFVEAGLARHIRFTDLPA